MADGKCVETLSGHTDRVNCVAFSSDGSRVVSGGRDKNIIVWDVAKGSPVETLEGSPGPVYSVCFCPVVVARTAHELKRGLIGQTLHDVLFFLKQVFTNESLYDVPG